MIYKNFFNTLKSKGILFIGRDRKSTLIELNIADDYFKAKALVEKLEGEMCIRDRLGMCPTLAVTSSAVNGLGMGLSTTVVLICSNILISLFRKVIPKDVYKRQMLRFQSAMKTVNSRLS